MAHGKNDFYQVYLASRGLPLDQRLYHIRRNIPELHSIETKDFLSDVQFMGYEDFVKVDKSGTPKGLMMMLYEASSEDIFPNVRAKIVEKGIVNPTEIFNVEERRGLGGISTVHLAFYEGALQVLIDLRKNSVRDYLMRQLQDSHALR